MLSRVDKERRNCVSQAKKALHVTTEDGNLQVLNNVLDWHMVRYSALDYCREYVDWHRTEVSGVLNMSVAAPYDSMQEKEIASQI